MDVFLGDVIQSHVACSLKIFPPKFIAVNSTQVPSLTPTQQRHGSGVLIWNCVGVFCLYPNTYRSFELCFHGLHSRRNRTSIWTRFVFLKEVRLFRGGSPPAKCFWFGCAA